MTKKIQSKDNDKGTTHQNTRLILKIIQISHTVNMFSVSISLSKVIDVIIFNLKLN